MVDAHLSRPFCVGIAGGSASGKTTLADKILRWFPKGCALVVCADWYYRDLSQTDEKYRASFNFDHPSALEHELLIDQMQGLMRGESVLAPVYDYASHRRIGQRTLLPADLLIVEGLFALYWRELRNLYDLKVFVTCDEDIRLERRIERDMRERGRLELDVRRRFTDHVLPMHAQHVEPQRRYAGIVIPGDNDEGNMADELARLIGMLMRS